MNTTIENKTISNITEEIVSIQYDKEIANVETRLLYRVYKKIKLRQLQQSLFYD